MTTTLAQITSRAAAATAAHQLEHTTAAVHELARIYGFDASEALQKLDIAPPQQTATNATLDAVRLDPDVLRFAEKQASSEASAPARDDVIARLLADEDPVPSRPAPKRKTSPKRSPKQSSEQKQQKEAERLRLKEQKAAEKAAARVEKQALKALARFLKTAEKAAKDAPKAAAKAEKEALKAQKAVEKAQKAAEKERKAAEKAQKAAERAKKAPKAVELEEDELAVEEFVLEGVTYLRSTAGEMFDLESHDPIGWWNEQDRCIATERVC